MGITASLLRIPAAKLDAYLADSGQLDADLFLEDDEQADADLDAHRAAGEASAESLYLDKSWDGLIYLLSGSGIATTDLSNPDNLARAILSGDLIDEEKEEDREHGYVHYRTVAETAALAARLAAIQKGDLRRNYTPAAMDDVYPGIIWRRDGEEALQYLLDYFDELQAFYTEAAAQQQAVISFLN